MDKLFVVSEIDGIIDLHPFVRYMHCYLQQQSIKEMENDLMELRLQLEKCDCNTPPSLKESVMESLEQWQKVIKACQHLD